MLFSIRISEIFESRMIYELLKKDNPAVYLLFVLCNRLALDGAINHGKEFLEDLKNGILPEIPDYDVNLVTKHENYIRTGKMEYDMTFMAKDNETIGKLLYILFKDVWDLTTKDLYYDNDGKLLVMINLIKEINTMIQDAPASLYENNLPNIMKRFDWTEVEREYQKEKKRNCVTMEWLQEKQEEVIKDALELGIMNNAGEPSTQYLESVDYDFHRSFLPCSYNPPVLYKVAYAQIMKLAKRVKGLFIPNLGEYGKHFAPILYNFRPEQKQAIFKVIKKMDLIHKDMVKENEELGQYLGFNQENTESLENTKYFAPYFHLSKMLGEEWFKKNRADAKYNEQWAEKFIEGLLGSEFGLQIAKYWKDCGNQIKGYVIGCLKEAGVFKENVSNDSLARDAGIMSNTRTFGKYIGKESLEQPYAEWIKEHVNDYC